MSIDLVGMADLGLDEGPIEEQLSVGILGVLSPAVQQVDSKITEVRYVCWQFGLYP